MTPKTILFFRAKTLCLGAAIILTMLVLLVAVATPAAQAQTFTKLYDFRNYAPNPFTPSGPLTQGRDGNLYGTAALGGAHTLSGSLFKITPTGTLTLLTSFDGIHGSDPLGGLTMGTDGSFYGTTNSGGTLGYGTVFKVTPGGKLTVLYNFTGGSDGGNPYAPPIEGPDGSIYGTAYSGGLGYGTVYRIKPTNEFTVLHQFDPVTGEKPYAPLILASDGNFYGTTYDGGEFCCGTIFKMSTNGNMTVVFNFQWGLNGYPKAPLTQGLDGNFYGVGTASGVSDYIDGFAFELTPAGQLTVLCGFQGWNGSVPDVSLVQATDGNFYGATQAGGANRLGVLYTISPDSIFTLDYSFVADNGQMPDGLSQHTNGVLYGVAKYAGAYTGGTFYSLDIGAAPFVGLVTTSGHIGKNIGILGQGFTGTTSVSFNGIPASFTVSADTYLEATVPDGALTGSVTVTTPTGTLTSNTPFRVTPKILNFTPTSGAVGTPVVITGKGLTQTLRVGFGGVAATSFTVDSDTQITAIVPVGAVTGKIAVATQGGHDAGARVFTVTP